MKKSTELRNKLAAIGKEMGTLSNDPAALEAAGGTARIKELFAEEDATRALLDAELDAEKTYDQLSQRSANLRGFLDDPAPAPGREPDPAITRGTQYGNGVETVGYTPAGQTYIQRRADGSMEMTAAGAGLLSSAKMEKIGTREYRDGFMAYIKGYGDRSRISDANFRAIQEGLDDQGGYFVPPEIALMIIQRLPTPTSLSPHYFTWPTGRDRVTFPKVNYTGASDDPNAYLYSTGVRVQYAGEIPNDQNTINTTQPALGEVTIPVETAMMSLDVSRNMIDDSPIGILSFLEGKLRETAMLEYDNRSVNGTGVGQASGIISGQTPVSGTTSTTVPQYIPSTATSALTADSLKSLAFSLAPQYLNENTRYAMNWTSTAQAISEMKDGQGEYLWSDGTQDRGLSNSILGRRLLGFPVSYSQFIPSVAANAFPIMFGDFSGYYLVQRLGLSIQILFETKAKQNMLEIVARLRFGGQLAEPWKIKLMKVAVS